MLRDDIFDYAVAIRREIHRYPEIGFDLPKTLALVRRELDGMGIPYTEEFGQSSIVATINPACKGFTIGIRADMDALPINEKTDVPFKSQNPGAMHACGHDAHTAMLLATAKVLKEQESSLKCRVKLLFTPAEEYIEPGCKQLAANGVMDDIDCAVACHVSPVLDTGKIAVSEGPINANSMGFTVDFYGTSSHVAFQHRGVDAISMAVEAYTAMQIMVTKELPPLETRLFNIGTIHGGKTNNIICNHCTMFGSSRAHTDAISEKLITRIRQICEAIAQMHGGEAKVTVNKFLPYTYNNSTVTQKLRQSAIAVVGSENVLPKKQDLGGEDFGFLSRKKPCCFFRIGTRSSEATAKALHADDFDLDEQGMRAGIAVFLQFVHDHMEGFDIQEETP